MTVDENCERLAREVASYQAIMRRLDAYTQQLETEARDLQHEQTLGQTILDVLPDPILALDCNGRIVRWNSAATRLFSLPAGAVPVPAVCATALPCPRCFGEGCPLRRDLAPAERQVRITGPDGMPCAFALSAIPLPVAGSAEQILLLYYRDITELSAQLDKENG